jgi:hypothetical protein
MWSGHSCPLAFDFDLADCRKPPPFDRLRAGFLAKDARNGAPGVD